MVPRLIGTYSLSLLRTRFSDFWVELFFLRYIEVGTVWHSFGLGIVDDLNLQATKE